MSMLREIAATARPALSAEREEFRRLYLAGRLGEARALAERCFDAGVERIAWVHNLASVVMEEGNLRAAFYLYLTHADLLDDCTDPYSVGNFFLSYGIAGKKLGVQLNSPEYFGRSEGAFKVASKYFDQAGVPGCKAYAENGLANLFIVSGQAADAFEHIDSAQRLFEGVGEVANAAACEDTRALAYEALGRFVDAFECAARAVATLERCGPAEAKSLAQARSTLERVYATLKVRN